MKKEADVKAEVKKVLNSYGRQIWWYMPVPTGFGVQGVPDFICSVRGRMVAIETKFGKNGLTKYQVKQMEEITASGAAHMVINEDNVYALKAIIDGIVTLEESNAGTA